MGVWRYRCLECKKEIEESYWGTRGLGEIICKPCCHMMVERKFAEKRGISMRCDPCWEQGIMVQATRVDNGKGYCEPCWKNKGFTSVKEDPFAEPEKKEEKVEVQFVPKKASDIDWVAVQKRYDSGIPVSQLVKELGVSNYTVYVNIKAKHTKNHKKETMAEEIVRENKDRRFKQKKVEKTVAKQVQVEIKDVPVPPAGPMLAREKYAPIIADLRQKRDKLDLLIGLLETI